MEPGPLPPHERAWRHPSELGPPPHEPTSTSGRVLIVTSAAVSLLLVGLLALAITPNQTSSPIAGSVTAAASSRSFPAAIASSSALTTAIDGALPVVTPIGDEGWAVTTWEAVAGQSGWMDARLPSGEVVEIEVVGKDATAGLVVVTLPATAATKGYQLAADRPGPSDTVVVKANNPKVVALDDLVSLDVEEATPVLDGAGALIGLCTRGGRDGTTLMTVDTMPESPDPPAASSTIEVATTVPVTTAVVATTTVESTIPDSTGPDTSAVDTTAVETTVDSTTPPTTEPSSTSSSVIVRTTGR